MNKRIIWTITILMGIAFTALLVIQIVYMRNLFQLHQQQFDRGVRQSLYATARYLEEEEIKTFLDANLSDLHTQSISLTQSDNPLQFQEGVQLSFSTPSGLSADLTIKGNSTELSKISTGGIFLGGHYINMRDAYRDHFLYHRGVLDEVVISIIASASDRTVRERADSALVANSLRERLDSVGIHLPFEFAVVNMAGVPQYSTADFDLLYNKDVYSWEIFPESANGDERYFLRMYFPNRQKIVYGATKYMYPAFVLTFILLAVFIYTIVVAFRQKKLSEMKIEFINNMTHEFKTPLSSISLAAQMLADDDIRKSPEMLKQLSKVVRDETKRLRYQVDKVLQMQMFESDQISMHFSEFNVNEVIENIVTTFRFKVEKYGGSLSMNLDAIDGFVEADQLHFTNVIFTILDNSLKYRDPERPLNIEVATHDLNERRIGITIADNGIGIKKENLKKVFDKFYRVPTGNVHNVKGFGLGLAYAKMIVKEFRGTIQVESEPNVGTKIIITLPLYKI